MHRSLVRDFCIEISDTLLQKGLTKRSLGKISDKRPLSGEACTEIDLMSEISAKRLPRERERACTEIFNRDLCIRGLLPRSVARDLL